MADLYVRAQQQSVGRGVDGTWLALRATRDGSPIVMPWLQALVLEGRCFSAPAPQPSTINITGLTVLAGASLGDDDKLLYVDIPDGTAFLPLEVRVSSLVTGAAIAQYLVFVSPTLNGTGGSETAITPINLRLDSPVSTAATAAHTADTEVDVLTGVEVWLLHDVTSFDIDAAVGFENNRVWNVQNAPVAPVGVDGSSLDVQLYQVTSGTAFAQATWAELPESAFL